MSERVIGALVSLGLLALPTQSDAGAWTLEAGRGQVVATVTASSADEIFDSRRDLQPAARYDKFEFQTLFEYGVYDWFTVIVAPGLQRVEIAAPVNARRVGLGFSEFGGRARIWHGANWVVSAQATVRIPGTFDIGNPAAIGHNRFEHDFRLLYGYSFAVGTMPAFVDLQLAQRFRSGDQPSELRLDATFGVRPAPQWLMLAQLFNVVSEGSSPPLFPSYDYSKLQLSVIHDLNQQWSLQAGGFTAFRGRNALQENGLLAGVWYRF